MTTIVSVRRGNQVALAGDGQVSLGNTVMKGNASKVRRLYRGKVLAGFAGALKRSWKNTKVISPKQRSSSPKTGAPTERCAV